MQQGNTENLLHKNQEEQEEHKVSYGKKKRTEQNSTKISTEEKTKTCLNMIEQSFFKNGTTYRHLQTEYAKERK